MNRSEKITSIITESLDKPYPIQYRKNVEWQGGKKGWIGEFRTEKGLIYEIMAVFSGFTEGEKQQRAERIKNRKRKILTPGLPQGGIWEIHFNQIIGDRMSMDSYVHDITGTGDSFRVFATVLQFIQKLISVKTPQELLIKSKDDEENRTKLYLSLIKRYSSKVGYKIAKIGKTKEDGLSKDVIQLVKIK